MKEDVLLHSHKGNTAVTAEGLEGGRGEDKALRHRETRLRQLAQGGRLAPRLGEVLPSDLVKP